MNTKKSRFEKLQVVKNLKETPEDTPEPQTASADQKRLESLSSQMRRDLKSGLKQASAREHRKVYQIIEEAVSCYLAEHHPDLLK